MGGVFKINISPASAPFLVFCSHFEGNISFLFMLICGSKWVRKI
jgi:hypothetical protein